MGTGTIELICGCMFSGKTTELIRRLRACGLHIAAFKPAIDDRYSPTDIVSHDGTRVPAQPVRNPGEILDRGANASVVAIDEIHFFDESLVDVCHTLARRGVRVICSGLDRDMWGNQFPHIRKLGRLAQTTVLLGVCRKCGRPADRTQRTAPLLNDNLVGGPEAFEPRCLACFTPPPEPKPAKPIRGLAS